MQFSEFICYCRIVTLRFLRFAGHLIVPIFLLVILNGTVQEVMADASPQVHAPVMLANSYQRGIDLKAYWVSEKYDGVRGYWDGHKLWTRGGEVVAAPDWFVKGWPNVAMDGELWAGRGNFPLAVSTVRMQKPDDGAWRRMRFMVFDLPDHGDSFDQRLASLKLLIKGINLPWVQAVKQVKVESHQALLVMMQKTVAQGGEGLMLHRGASLYRAERNDDLLKLKPYDDADAIVVAYLPGKGKYFGLLGALLVETPHGLRFKLGSGFSDAERAAPPPIGSLVTYRYRGINKSGIPRFATFLRVRGDIIMPKK